MGFKSLRIRDEFFLILRISFMETKKNYYFDINTEHNAHNFN
jgi:hypothetical protein